MNKKKKMRIKKIELSILYNRYRYERATSVIQFQRNMNYN